MKYTLVNNLAITSTSVYTYRNNTAISLVPVANNSQPVYVNGSVPVTSYLIMVYNGGNQNLTVQLIGNIDATQKYPDYNMGNAYTVPAGASIGIPLNFADYPINYASVALSYTTAPTSGSVSGYLYTYY